MCYRHHGVVKEHTLSQQPNGGVRERRFCSRGLVVVGLAIVWHFLVLARMSVKEYWVGWISSQISTKNWRGLWEGMLL